MHEQESIIKYEFTSKLKRPQTAILMKQFRIAGVRPKTPLEVSQIAKVDCTCCNQLVYSNSLQSLCLNPAKQGSSKTLYSFVGKKLSIQKEEQKRLIRSGNKSIQERESVIMKGKRLDPYEFINQKYQEILKEQEEEQKMTQQSELQQSAFMEIEGIRDQLFSPNILNTFQLTQKIEGNKTRPQSGIKKNQIMNQLVLSSRSKRDSNASVDQASLIISKVVDVRKMEQNAYYSPRDKVLKDILNSPKAQQALRMPSRGKETQNQHQQDHFLMSHQTIQNAQSTAATKQSDYENNSRRISSLNQNYKNQQPNLMDIPNSSNNLQNRASSPIQISNFQINENNEIKNNKLSTNELSSENPQIVFQQIKSYSPSQSYIQEEQSNISIQNISHNQLKAKTKLKNQSYLYHLNKLNQTTKKQNSTTSPYKQQNLTNRSQQMLSTTQKDSSHIHLTTNETLKTEEDFQTPHKSARTHYYNDFIKSPYLSEFPQKAHNNNLMFNSFSPLNGYNQKSYVNKIQYNQNEMHSYQTWRVSTEPDQLQGQSIYNNSNNNIQYLKLNPQPKKINVSTLLSTSMLQRNILSQNSFRSITSRENKRVSFK